MRGGAWDEPPENLAAAIRNDNDPTNANDNVGFRVALARANTLARVTVQEPSGRPRASPGRRIHQPVRSSRPPADRPDGHLSPPAAPAGAARPTR